MTRTKTVQEQTIHGSIEYDVVECDSCGQDVVEEEANEFTIGDREGYACDVCKEEGPASFPPEKAQEAPIIVTLVLSVAFPMLVPVIAADIAKEGVKEIDVVWVGAVLGTLLWIGGAYWLSTGGTL